MYAVNEFHYFNIHLFTLTHLLFYIWSHYFYIILNLVTYFNISFRLLKRRNDISAYA